MDTADFRSDTLTRPDQAMRDAMATADVGDDVFGEDPTVAELEREAAAFLGQPRALFVPSGTMANQIALAVHCRPGDEILCDARSHVFLYEGGGAARWTGAQLWPFASDAGFPRPEQLAGMVRADDPHLPRTRVLALENTHNSAGGRVLGPVAAAALIAEAHRLGLQVHVDGARLANAAVASGVAAGELVAGVDSVSLCFSKGLGAPVGSVIAGSAEFVHQARRVRKALGGGMRQVGILAAAARLALRDGPARLAVDHRRAKAVAEALAPLPAFAVDLDAVESNILMLDVTRASAKDLLEHLESHGIRAMVFGPRRLRFVFHRDLTDAHVDRCIEQATAWAQRG
ncbi:MAG: aminotransferase class I/II-fold pyridoxal phosphate-dependent enzyme [Planctomycetes bacterium]|nr:aminotransferase class I/II-fold pyridoxal phosphate-dependent enzyme [Planctomycetota bacterium]